MNDGFDKKYVDKASLNYSSSCCFFFDHSKKIANFLGISVFFDFVFLKAVEAIL